MSYLQPQPHARYHTITTLGRGGMGEAFLAAMSGPPGLNQLAVLKRIWPELADDPDFIAMFLDEARLALRLRHPNIVQTFEVGQARIPKAGPGGDQYFIAMEYLAGQPLTTILERLSGSDAFGLQTRLHVVIEVLAALEYAHDVRDVDKAPLGVVHRDISPHNVFITYEGAVKLMDFGIAKSTFSSHQTNPGVVKGRFAYGAPEQIQGRPVDRRADLFSVGVMLWELLTNRRMFRGRSRAEVVSTLAGAGPPLSPLPDELPLPRELRLISKRALALRPAARYQVAGAFRQDLVDVLNCLPPEPRPLGKVVASAFRGEKGMTEKLIEQFFEDGMPTEVRSGIPILKNKGIRLAGRQVGKERVQSAVPTLRDFPVRPDCPLPSPSPSPSPPTRPAKPGRRLPGPPVPPPVYRSTTAPYRSEPPSPPAPVRAMARSGPSLAPKAAAAEHSPSSSLAAEASSLDAEGAAPVIEIVGESSDRLVVPRQYRLLHLAVAVLVVLGVLGIASLRPTEQVQPGVPTVPAHPVPATEPLWEPSPEPEQTLAAMAFKPAGPSIEPLRPPPPPLGETLPEPTLPPATTTSVAYLKPTPAARESLHNRSTLLRMRPAPDGIRGAYRPARPRAWNTIPRRADDDLAVEATFFDPVLPANIPDAPPDPQPTAETAAEAARTVEAVRASLTLDKRNPYRP